MTNLINHVDPKLLTEGTEDARYVDSPFRYLKQLHAKQKGKRYEEITESVLKRIGYKVSKPESTDYDRIVDGEKVEIKGSTLNKGTDNFSFLQIRPNQDYDLMYFSMFYPNEFVIMAMTKEQIKENIDKKVFKNQHGGKKGNSGTYCYYGNRETLETIGAYYIP